MVRMTLWTGPCQVSECANALVDMGMENVTEGTEHVYFDAPRCFTKGEIERKMYAYMRGEISAEGMAQ